jgi:hypothetical protein
MGVPFSRAEFDGDGAELNDEPKRPLKGGTDLNGALHRAMGAPVANATATPIERFGFEMIAPSRHAALAARIDAGRIKFGENMNRLIAALPAIVERERELLADAVAARVTERIADRSNDVPLFVDYPEAARLLSCSVAALKHRKARGSIQARFLLETGRRVQFRRALLAELKTTFTGRTQ